MIDINKAKVFYKEYISKYNPENPKIALKIAHIYRTAQKAKWLATKLKLSKEDVLLAELIGMLHDIGRFEQAKNYNTFLDKDSINHGEYGVRILFEDNLIRNFIKDTQYDEIIKKAILNHNKKQIDKKITEERELMHCKIIRDADKLDIYNVLLNDPLEAAYPFNMYPKEYVTKEVKEDFINTNMVDNSKLQSCADLLIGQFAFVFDINYIYSLELIKKNDYLNKIANRYDAKQEETLKDINEIKQTAIKYIEEKIDEGEICLKS